MSTDLVRVKVHVNDVLKHGRCFGLPEAGRKCILNWLGALTSATAVFKLITVLFPHMEKETFRLFVFLPWIGLGYRGELEPLVKSDVP
ncbi:unnamed protein product [Cladocopium goreaui]|uniref:Uncharacterized protein n=1 Tax=Cladocopium goreaui TaxID=2562237 RepID=A0A9P1CZS1_9DINO|nr:unnamed protein product [Cladocopium goreaui]